MGEILLLWARDKGLPGRGWALWPEPKAPCHLAADSACVTTPTGMGSLPFLFQSCVDIFVLLVLFQLCFDQDPVNVHHLLNGQCQALHRVAELLHQVRIHVSKKPHPSSWIMSPPLGPWLCSRKQETLGQELAHSGDHNLWSHTQMVGWLPGPQASTSQSNLTVTRSFSVCSDASQTSPVPEGELSMCPEIWGKCCCFK